MQLFYCPDIVNGGTSLNTNESFHCVKVLRKKKTDQICVIDGMGFFYDAIIVNASYKKVSFEIQRKWSKPKRNYKLHIAIAPTKSFDRFKWFLEKVSEIGIDEITPIICDHSERKTINYTRMQKIILSACKQSMKAKLPKINPNIYLKEFLQINHKSPSFIAHCSQSSKISFKSISDSNSNVLILIGPEGDFSKSEIYNAIKQGFVSVSLSNSRLRTETAGIIACHTLYLSHESS